MKKKIGAVVAAAAVASGLLVGGAGAASASLALGSHVQYPSAGGTWQYGFWNVKVRSYYTVSKCHGSTVKYNGSTSRSANTASGKKSVAEKYAVNLPWNDDAYYYRTC